MKELAHKVEACYTAAAMARVEKIVMALFFVMLFLIAYGLIFSANIVWPFTVYLLVAIIYLLFAGVYFATEWPESKMSEWLQGSAKSVSESS